MDKTILFKEKRLCCGCSACYAICPAKAIVMVPDEEGFFYPMVNEEKCRQCMLCKKVCPMKQGLTGL